MMREVTRVMTTKHREPTTVDPCEAAWAQRASGPAAAHGSYGSCRRRRRRWLGDRVKCVMLLLSLVAACGGGVCHGETGEAVKSDARPTSNGKVGVIGSVHVSSKERRAMVAIGGERPAEQVAPDQCWIFLLQPSHGIGAHDARVLIASQVVGYEVLMSDVKDCVVNGMSSVLGRWPGKVLDNGHGGRRTGGGTFSRADTREIPRPDPSGGLLPCLDREARGIRTGTPTHDGKPGNGSRESAGIGVAERRESAAAGKWLPIRRVRSRRQFGRVVRPSVESFKYADVSYMEINHLEVATLVPCCYLQQPAPASAHPLLQPADPSPKISSRRLKLMT
nr:unnamed protein product [Digitaria exilis]